MHLQETVEAMTHVAQVARQAGLKGTIDEEGSSFGMMFAINEARTQLVKVRYVGKQADGRSVVNLFSPAKVIKKGLLSGFPKDLAVELLRRNSQLCFASFGIFEFGDVFIVGAGADHLLETLDAEELRTSAWSVAAAADALEKEFGGRDDF